jgi:hypothetical protein
MIVIGNNLDHRAALLNEAIESVWRGMEAGVLREEKIRSALTRIRQLKLSIRD